MARHNPAGHLWSWFSGVFALSICLGIVLFLVVKGVHVLDVPFLTTDPQPSLVEALTGGILAPILGTIFLTALGTLFALPWALATAIYLAEYAKEGRLAGTLQTGIDVLSGVPTIVFAVFGLAVFTHPKLSVFSTMVEGVTDAKAFGRSFLVASLTMAMMILPFVTKSIEEALRSVPRSYREAAFALGLSKWRTVRKVILPAAAAGIVTGVVLGVGRIAGDTAIVWLCLGGSMTLTGPQPWWEPQHWTATLQNTGSTLTSYIYYSSPAGEGNAADKAFGAALVLVVIILALNAVVDYLGRFSRFKED
ncbi:MAG: phosphate ABC transporter permease PstA [Bacillota bacterium]